MPRSVNVIPTVIIIATSGRDEVLRKTLESISEGLTPKLVEHIHIVENGSHLLDEQALQVQFPHVSIKLHTLTKPHKGLALNFVLRAIPESFCIFFDDDVRVAKKTVKQYIDAAHKRGVGHYFGGPTGAIYQEQPPTWMQPFFPPSVRGFNLGEDEKEVKEGYFMGFNWAAYSSDILHAGGFDPLFGPGSELGASGQENTIQRKMRGLGLKAIYLPACRVQHVVPADRCSPEWLADRLERQGIEAGLGETNLGWKKRFSLWFRIRKLALQAAYLRMRGRKENAFEKTFDARGCRGTLKGIRHRRRA